MPQKSSLVKDAADILRLGLNHQPTSRSALSTRAQWPDGLYTAPTDEALRFDIEANQKAQASNMPALHAARQGRTRPLVLLGPANSASSSQYQDMPSAPALRHPHPQRPHPRLQRRLRRRTQGNDRPAAPTTPPSSCGSPSTRAGANTTPASVTDVQTRPTPPASSTTPRLNRPQRRRRPRHPHLPRPRRPQNRGPTRHRSRHRRRSAASTSPSPIHTWQQQANWSYKAFKTPDELTDAYTDLIAKLHPPHRHPGLSAAVYTRPPTSKSKSTRPHDLRPRFLIKGNAENPRAPTSNFSPPPPSRAR